MKFLNLIDEKFVFVKQPVSSYTEALHFMADELSRERSIDCGASTITDALMEREALGGTVLPNGLAIPHVRIDCLNDFWLAALSPKEPLEHPNGNISLIIMFLIPKKGSDMYLQTLSGLSKFTAKAENMSALTHAAVKRQLLLAFSELEIKKDFLVGDIMTREPITVQPETKIKELADLLYSKNLSYIPVLGSQGQFIGEVTLFDLIREGVPDYALRIGDLSFLKSFEPFEELIRKEDVLTVKEIMSKPKFKVHPGDSIAAAGLIFIQNQRRQLPVVEGNSLVGVLSINDLLKKVIRV